MDDELREEMLRYYHQRADEYDGLYEGRVATAIGRDVYVEETAAVGRIARCFGKGAVLDVGCGTGFWLQFYARNCSSFTFLDQSDRMLARSRERAESAGVAAQSVFVQAGFEDASLPEEAYDAALVGFVLSHVPAADEEGFLSKLSRVVKPQAQLLVIDSAWSPERQADRRKAGTLTRVLEDGREFRIYKRYFEAAELSEMVGCYGFGVRRLHFGKVFIALLCDRA